MLDKRDIARLQNNLARLGVGGNLPPSPLESAKEAMTELGIFLREHPIIANHAEHKEAGAYVERVRVTLAEMEDHRRSLVDPLNAKLNAINTPYRIVREPLDKLFRELKKRWNDFANAEEAKRIAAAEAARKAAEDAERLAREAEAREKEAIQNASQGECTDIGGATVEADAAFTDFQKAQRAAAIAERNVPVRLKSIRGGPALAMRTNEVLTITDTAKVLKALGLTPKIKDAILSSAREYRREFNELPPGIEATFERSL